MSGDGFLERLLGGPHSWDDAAALIRQAAARIAELEAPSEARAMNTDPLTSAEHAYLARLCVRVGTNRPWYMHNSVLRKEFIDAARKYLPHLLALSPPTLFAARALTISDIVREHGMTTRHWTRLAPTIPGAWQPAGAKGKWLFNPVEFARWRNAR